MQIAGGIPRFHRSGRDGFVESEGYQDAQPPVAALSLAHLKSALLSLSDNDLEMTLDTSGIVVLTSHGGGFKTVLRVHGVRTDKSSNWKVSHTVGRIQEDLPFEEFKDIRTGVFAMACEPTLRKNRLMLPTPHAIVVRRDVKAAAFPWPRSLLLKALTGSKPMRLAMTDKGYWALLANGLWYLVSGHQTGEALSEEYDKPATAVSELQSKRLLEALDGAYRMTAKSARLMVDPVEGFIARDQYGAESTYQIGKLPCKAFAIQPKTAEVIADAIRQDAAEFSTLGMVDHDTMRITRGLWDVDFKVFGCETKFSRSNP